MLDKYPTNFAATEFEDWGVKTHVAVGGWQGNDTWGLWLDGDNSAEWLDVFASAIEAYFQGAIGLAVSSVSDESDGDPDGIHTTPNSPSNPATDVSERTTASTTDDDFIDVEVFYDPRAP